MVSKAYYGMNQFSIQITYYGLSTMQEVPIYTVLMKRPADESKILGEEVLHDNGERYLILAGDMIQETDARCFDFTSTSLIVNDSTMINFPAPIDIASIPGNGFYSRLLNSDIGVVASRFIRSFALQLPTEADENPFEHLVGKYSQMIDQSAAADSKRTALPVEEYIDLHVADAVTLPAASHEDKDPKFIVHGPLSKEEFQLHDAIDWAMIDDQYFVLLKYHATRGTAYGDVVVRPFSLSYTDGNGRSYKYVQPPRIQDVLDIIAEKKFKFPWPKKNVVDVMYKKSYAM